MNLKTIIFFSLLITSWPELVSAEMLCKHKEKNGTTTYSQGPCINDENTKDVKIWDTRGIERGFSDLEGAMVYISKDLDQQRAVLRKHPNDLKFECLYYEKHGWWEKPSNLALDAFRQKWQRRCSH